MKSAMTCLMVSSTIHHINAPTATDDDSSGNDNGSPCDAAAKLVIPAAPRWERRSRRLAGPLLEPAPPAARIDRQIETVQEYHSRAACRRQTQVAVIQT